MGKNGGDRKRDEVIESRTKTPFSELPPDILDRFRFICAVAIGLYVENPLAITFITQCSLRITRVEQLFLPSFVEVDK